LTQPIGEHCTKDGHRALDRGSQLDRRPPDGDDGKDHIVVANALATVLLPLVSRPAVVLSIHRALRGRGIGL
jgi:hypothetical protein